jgi:hypothetical protein
VILARSGSSAWGGLRPSIHTYYIVLKKHSTDVEYPPGRIEQTITGMVAGSTYELTFLAANRPWGCNGPCIQTQLGVFLNSVLELTVDPPTTDFQRYQLTIPVTTATLTVSFENMRSPTSSGDSAVFVADVTLNQGENPRLYTVGSTNINMGATIRQFCKGSVGVAKRPLQHLYYY